MKHVMSHDLSPELAKKVAEHAFDAYRTKYASYDPTLTWRNDQYADASFRAKGVELGGSIELSPGKIAFELKVPFLFRVFEKKAIQVMQDELEHWVKKAKAGEI